MEIYRFNTPEKPIVYGKMEEIVHKKHTIAYGKESANNILNKAREILSSAFAQKNDLNSSNNVLIVGKVQSGKTSNLEMISALAFDNGINFLVIFGGYDTDLVNQSKTRFKETFDTIPYSDDEEPFLFSTTETDDFSFLDDTFIETAIDDNKPIIIVCLKRPVALARINECIKKLDTSIINALIIDDEGDQASLNTNIHTKKNEGSATYNEIKTMKKLLNDPIYFSVTATPQANIFQPDLSELRPSSIHLIPPADGYTGADCFHLISEHVCEIDEKDIKDVKDLKMTTSLQKSIDYFFLASVLMKRRQIKNSEMIIHSHREKDAHEKLFDVVNTYIDDLKECIKNDEPELEFKFNRMKSIYSSNYFSSMIISENPWDDVFLDELKKIIKQTSIIKQNSDGRMDKTVLSAMKHKIFIGGDLLQRGITFKYLVVTYFTRWANSGNMDTTLQRARWFGYRGDYLDLCKIFSTKNIFSEFSNLASIENDLWRQFELVDNKELDISDIFIESNDSSLNPTRKNVANYKKVEFGRFWTNQKYGLFDKDKISKNNELFEELCSKYIFENTYIGRTDSNPSAQIAIIKNEDIIKFIQNTYYIFDQAPFSTSELINSIGKKDICLELMYFDYSKYRTRSFYENKVLALQQGADSVNNEKRKYYGDSYVIAYKDVICIQAYRIMPIINNREEQTEYLQYMYSFKFPINKVGFIKK